VKAALQQTATEKMMRAVRTKADMIERPCFRRRRSDFPIPFPESYRALCAKTFSVGFMSRWRGAVIGRCGEWILKSEFWRVTEYKRSPKYADNHAASPKNVRHALTALEWPDSRSRTAIKRVRALNV
jgi:hypothetical protein